MEFNHIFSSLQVAGKQLKSRLFHSVCYVTELEHGPDPKNRLTVPQMFARATRYYMTAAKAGAAIVSISGGGFPSEGDGPKNPHMKFSYLDPEIQAGYNTLLGQLHQEGTLCIAGVEAEPMGARFSQVHGLEQYTFHGDYNDIPKNAPCCTLQQLETCALTYAKQGKILKELGFDGMNIHMSYHSSLLCQALSPLFNQRADMYGGSTIEERSRYPLHVLKTIRDACGDDFIIELTMSPFEEEPGFTLEDWLRFLELAQGLFDIVQVRGYDGSYTHVTSFNSSREAPVNLQYAEAAKKRGIRGIIAPVGGFGAPDVIERVLTEGKCDGVFMARMFYAEPEYAQKLKAGHPEKIRPCLGCMQNCGFPSCAVNPKYGLILDPQLFPPVTEEKKKVAVIGGGPAGIRAALSAAELGHQVTLFEKAGELGGQLDFAKYPSFKWRILDYLNWLKQEIATSNVAVHLNTEATPELLRPMGFDVIFLAMGSTPTLPDIPGAMDCGAWNVNNVWGNQEKLGERVVVVGGSSSSRETALYLAQCGHKVTMVTRKQEMYSDNNHCIWGEYEQYQKEKNLTVIEFATTTEIAPDHITVSIQDRPLEPLNFFTVGKRQMEEIGKVREKIPGYVYPEYPYAVTNGHPPARPEEPRQYPTSQREIPYDSIILSGGRAVPMDEMRSFEGVAEKIIVIGDAMAPASIHEATLTAYAGVRSI